MKSSPQAEWSSKTDWADLSNRVREAYSLKELHEIWHLAACSRDLEDDNTPNPHGNVRWFINQVMNQNLDPLYIGSIEQTPMIEEIFLGPEDELPHAHAATPIKSLQAIAAWRLNGKPLPKMSEESADFSP